MATKVAEFLGFKGDLVPQCAQQIKNLYKVGTLDTRQGHFTGSLGRDTLQGH